MTTTRSSMTRKPVEGYKIKPSGLVWYPISDKANYIFSNFYAQELTVNYPGKFSIIYKTPAHYFHALKAPIDTHQSYHSVINRQVTPQDAKEQANVFADRLPEWNEEAAYHGMLKVIRARTQDTEFKKALSETANGYIYLDGIDGEEENLLGRALMEVRNEIYKSEGKPEIEITNLFTLAKAELALKPSGVPFQNFAASIERARMATTDTASSVITVSPSSSTSTSTSTSASTSSSPAHRSSTTSSSTSASPAAQLSVETLDDIKAALGGTWGYRNTGRNDPVPFPCIFENDKDLRFEIINHEKVSSKSTKKEALEKMLIAFTLLNPGKKPTITVGSAELKTMWTTICTEKNIEVEIKVLAPAPAEEAKRETPSTRPLPTTTAGEGVEGEEDDLEDSKKESKVESEEESEEAEENAEVDLSTFEHAEEFEQKEDSTRRTPLPRLSTTSKSGLFSNSVSKLPARNAHVTSPTSSPTSSTSSTSSSPRPGGNTSSSS